MTARTVRVTPHLHRLPPDFTQLTSTEARRRVAQLAAMGLPESTIAMMTGWSVTDVRRALAVDIREAS
ncbi:MAG: hypothetical protein ACLPV2_09825 [Steroidobacteraceae bacterium]